MAIYIYIYIYIYHIYTSYWYMKYIIHTYKYVHIDIWTPISIIILNENKCSNQNTQSGWIGTKPRPIYKSLQETHFRHKDTYRLKVRGWKTIFHPNRNQKKVGIAILISDKTDLKIKNITRDKEWHYIMIKESVQVMT